MPESVCLIVNPSAGGGRAGRLAPDVQQALVGQHNLQVRRCDTRDLAHARELAQQAAARGETVAALSGDGMIGAIADVLRHVPDSLLAVLPGGRGNDLARVLGIPADPVAACAVVAHGTPFAMDLGEVDGKAFVGIASAGFDSDANRIANEAPSWLGNLVYAYGALRALLSWRPARFEVELDPDGASAGSSAGGSNAARSEAVGSSPGGPTAGRLAFSGYTIAACSSGVYGGGMRLAPTARLDDGLLDIVAIERVSKLRFLANLPKVFKGTHVQLPSVKVLQAAEVSISADRPFVLYADGDPIARLPARVRALPGAVRVLVPSGVLPSGRAPLRRRACPREPLMRGPLAPKLALARVLRALTRLRGGGGTSAPGKLLLRLDPDAIAALSARLPQGSVVVSATNGKTTTAALASGIFRQEGLRLVHNRAGANMAGGIASTLLDAVRVRGAIDGDIGLFEVDEFWLGELLAQLHPRAILLGNLFRDQLDRYGELESIAERWAAALAVDPARAATLVLNADDPLVADLGRARERGLRGGTGGPGPGTVLSRPGTVLYYGVDDDSLALPSMSHAADAKHCRRCGAPYVFDAVYLGHLGHYHCAACGQTRPQPTITATDVTLQGVRAARFTLHTPAGQAHVQLSLPGLYNVYNALAAAALATALEVPLPTIVAGLQSTPPAFGRAESVEVGVPAHPRELRILLVKNPAGANEVLRTLALEPGQHDLLGVLNDNIADGRDVSWIWDADFELLADRLRSVTCAGTRAAELALRLKYAGLDPARIRVHEQLAGALDLATANYGAPGAGEESSGAGEGPSRAGEDTAPPLYALPTYTAMLDLRQLLVDRGEAPSAWT